jgi:hypothetical protein
MLSAEQFVPRQEPKVFPFLSREVTQTGAQFSSLSGRAEQLTAELLQKNPQHEGEQLSFVKQLSTLQACGHSGDACTRIKTKRTTVSAARTTERFIL